MCLLKFEKLSATDLGCHVYIVLFHIVCDVGLSSCCFIFGKRFVSCQTCGWLASVFVWTLLAVIVPKGPAAHDPQTKENKKRENWNMNSKEEIWKEIESERGKHIKNPNTTWNMNKGRDRNSMNNNKTAEKNTYLDKRFSRFCMGNKWGTMNLGFSGRDLRLRT